MRLIKTFGILAIAVLCASAEKPAPQGTRFVYNSMGFSNGVTAKATIAVEPPAPLSVFAGMQFAIWSRTGDKYHRVVADTSQRAYFGYDISTEPIPHSPKIRVTIAPLSLTVDELETLFGATKVSGFRFLVLPRYPPPFTVENGDTVALDLLVSADGKQKIVDYIELLSKPPAHPGP